MYNYKIKLVKKQSAYDLDKVTILEKVEAYWSSLSNNGQVVGGFDIFLDNDIYYLTVVLPEEDSLSGAYDNDYVKEYSQKLGQYFDMEFLREGINIEYHNSCTCKNSSFYYLYSNSLQDESPLICGDCDKPVPLYKVPYIFNENEHFSVLDWQNARNNMDGLWGHSLWDRFTYGELSKHNSKLNREGRRICKAFEKMLGLPVYYHLFYFNGGKDCEIVPQGLLGTTPDVCPQCNGKWIRNLTLFKCEKCRLLSDNPELNSQSNND